jgi:stage II sporulation SpoM-like protein
MKAEQLALVQGWDETRATLRRWNAAPWGVLGSWALGSLAVTALLLAATWIVATTSTPDPGFYIYPGLTRPADLHDFAFVLARNGTVLTLHALACVAGFLAGSSMPEVAKGYKGGWRRLHELAGPAAIAFVGLATLFSLSTQALALGMTASDLSSKLGVSPLELLLTLTPHAVPELFALFLPLAAWTIASRRGAWSELLAATFVTTVLAIPLLIAAAAIETWVTPGLLISMAQ